MKEVELWKVIFFVIFILQVRLLVLLRSRLCHTKEVRF
jgi:hypothetical protein